MKPNTESVLVITPQVDLDVFEWVVENKSSLEKYIVKFGAILLRNFGIYSVSEFNRVAKALSPSLLDYMYRSTPRTKLGGKIYTATEYPANRTIPLHNENSYSNSWPKKIFFFSIVVADEGGETPIADSRKVYNRIDKSIRKKFEQNGILYVRNYHSGIDLSWQEVFQTNDQEVVSKYCQDNDIEFEWSKNSPKLITKQICHATIQHPTSKENVWFNQAHLFNISALDKNERDSLLKELGEKNLPRNAFYGNGEAIEIEALDHIREAYCKEKIKFQWQKGDILLLDNILVAHGREPYSGERKVAVAMA